MLQGGSPVCAPPTPLTPPPPHPTPSLCPTPPALGGAGILVRKEGKTIVDHAGPTLRSGAWDFVMLMCGTNDVLLGGKSAGEIWDGGLKALYDEALDRGSKVIGMAPLPNLMVSG